MITIIDIGISNIGSVKNALDYLKIKNKISRKKKNSKKQRKLFFQEMEILERE